MDKWTSTWSRSPTWITCWKCCCCCCWCWWWCCCWRCWGRLMERVLGSPVTTEVPAAVETVGGVIPLDTISCVMMLLWLPRFMLDELTWVWSGKPGRQRDNYFSDWLAGAGSNLVTDSYKNLWKFNKIYSAVQRQWDVHLHFFIQRQKIVCTEVPTSWQPIFIIFQNVISNEQKGG